MKIKYMNMIMQKYRNIENTNLITQKYRNIFNNHEIKETKL